jgi:predicted ATP-grasp superfamily ATP-dependent carboligase
MSHFPSSAGSAARFAKRHLRSAEGARPKVLLTMPGYHGTLAAVRNLGRNGVPVTTADPARFTTASASKYATEHVRCPPVRDTARFVEWLLALGRRRGPYVLLPTCDDTAFLYSLHRDELSDYFYLGLPDVTVLHSLLNKRLLREHAAAVGLSTPQSWMPSSLAEVEQLAREARFPLLVKPTTQVLFDPRVKGALVKERDQLVRTYEHVSGEAFGQELRDYDASVTRPIIQEFFTDAATTGIYSICGHVRDGRIVGTRSMRKVLQWPRRLGIGVCFEAAAPSEELVQRLQLLTQRVGFSGTFEAEFVEDGARRLLIDFNPRFYNQMGFDIARGLPLPLLAYRDAIGQPLDLPLPAAANNGADEVTAYAHGAALKLLLRSQRVSGALSPQEWQKWQHFRERQRHVDAVVDADDPLPALFDKMNIARDVARHPLRFLNVIALNRA